MQLGDLEECCKLPQRVRAEPSRQTTFGAFWSENALSGKAFKGFYKCLLRKNCQQIVPSHFSCQTDSSAKYQFLAFSITFGNKKKQIFPITDM